MTVRAWLAAAIRLHRWRLLLSLWLMTTEAVAALAMPWLAGRIASDLLGEVTAGIDTLAPALLGLLALQAALRISHGRILARTAQALAATLRERIYAHLQRLPVGFFHDRRRGDLIALLTHETDRLGEFVTGTLLGLVPQLVVLAGALVLMLQIDAALLVPVLLGVPGFFILVKLIGRQVRPLAAEIREAYGAATSLAEQSLAVMPAIKAFTREDIETARYAQAVGRLRDLETRMATVLAALGPALQFAAAAAVVLVLWLAGGRLSDSAMRPGELVAFLLYAALLTRPVARLADSWGAFQHARGAFRHMSEVLAVPAEAAEGGVTPQGILGRLRFEALSFAYPGRPMVLQDITLEIAPGETVALTGPNGAGKTTLIELLLRFHRPGSGRILLDGQDIAGLDLKALRRAIAVVPQQVMLIDGTIEENIRFARPGASAGELAAAVRAAQAEDFIAALPEGMQTRIGDRGVRLSGGQRQRLALARALLKDPAIVVLDEPTAMFDPEGEARFVRAARQAFAGRTVILVTHRPASLALADRVVSMEAGRIVSGRAA